MSKKTLIKKEYECQRCKNSFFATQTALYCSAACKSSAHQARKRNLQLQSLICHYCAVPLLTLRTPTGKRRNSRRSKFCCVDHKNRFRWKRLANKPVPLQITPKLLIWSKKYDEIPQVVALYRATPIIKTDPSFVVQKEKKKKVKSENLNFSVI